MGTLQSLPKNMRAYQLASYRDGSGSPRAGLVIDGEVLDAANALTSTREDGAPASVLGLLHDWQRYHPRLQEVALARREGRVVAVGRPLSEVTLLAPVLWPGTIFCAGANYRDHVAEMARALNLPPEPDPHERGLKPWHFLKATVACVRGTDSRVTLPAYARQVDWEAEIALVIGRECRNVAVEDALSYVAALTIVNDLSARDHIRRRGVPPESPFCFDWLSHKCFEGALPMGPWLVPLEDVGDPGNLGIRLWVNGELMQDSSSSNLIFSMAEQVAHLSSRLTLRPGDMIATGTPAGCGAARGRFLRDGDEVRIWVQGIGELVTRFDTSAQADL